MRSKNPIRYFWMVAASFYAAANAVQAKQPSELLSFSLGPLILRPQLELAERYDSNIYFTSANPTGDFITFISPGINMFIGRPERNYLSFDYALENVSYFQNDTINANNHYLSLTNQFQAAKWSWKGSDSIQFLSGILGGGLNFFNRIPVDRTVQNHDYTLTYNPTEKTGTYLKGLYSETDYQSGIALYDYNTIRGTAGFEFKALAKTSFFAELYYGQTAINPNHPSLKKGPHLDFMGGFVGVRGEFTPKLKGTIKAGYEARQFANNAPAPDGIVVEASLDYLLSAKTTISLSYQRTSGVSVESSGQSYVADTVGFHWLQEIGTSGKWFASFDGSYISNQYDVANRLDNLYRFNAGLAYRIQLWLTAGLNYEFEKFNSNLALLQQYDAHRFTARLAVGY